LRALLTAGEADGYEEGRGVFSPNSPNIPPISGLLPTPMRKSTVFSENQAVREGGSGGLWSADRKDKTEKLRG